MAIKKVPLRKLEDGIPNQALRYRSSHLQVLTPKHLTFIKVYRLVLNSECHMIKAWI